MGTEMSSLSHLTLIYATVGRDILSPFICAATNICNNIPANLIVMASVEGRRVFYKMYLSI